MGIEELVAYFRKGGSLETFCQDLFLNKNTEVIEIFMSKPFSLNTKLGFFEFEKTKGEIEYSSAGQTFYYLFDVLEEVKETKKINLTNNEIAKIMLSYAINDG